MSLINLLEILKTLVLASVLFVWVIRYENIVAEFKQYQLPDWLRDLVGIVKISFALMLLSQNTIVVLTGSGGIVVLMFAALFTHLRIKNSLSKMLPALTLFSFSIIIFIETFSY